MQIHQGWLDKGKRAQVLGKNNKFLFHEPLSDLPFIHSAKILLLSLRYFHFSLHMSSLQPQLFVLLLRNSWAAFTDAF